MAFKWFFPNKEKKHKKTPELFKTPGLPIN